jgi:hypothetical protein
VSDPLDLYEHLARLDRLQADADRRRREMGRELRAELRRAVVGTPIIVALFGAGMAFGHFVLWPSR